MWFDELEDIKFGAVLRYLELRFGASRWEDKDTYQSFTMGEIRKVTAWAKKRSVEPWQMMAAARYCADRELPVTVWWELEAYIPAAVQWLHSVREEHDNASFDAQFAEALRISLETNDGWYQRLVVVSERYRKEVYEEWLAAR